MADHGDAWRHGDVQATTNVQWQRKARDVVVGKPRDVHADGCTCKRQKLPALIKIAPHAKGKFNPTAVERAVLTDAVVVAIAKTRGAIGPKREQRAAFKPIAGCELIEEPTGDACSADGRAAAGGNAELRRQFAVG